MTIEKLKIGFRYGRRSFRKRDVVYLYFMKNDTVFHEIHTMPRRSIKKYNLQIGDCFLAKVAKSNYGIFEIDFTEKKDTLINKEEYKNQVYKTSTHRNKIE